MKKQQAREYFEQLKKLDKAKHMGIAQIINIITGGTIPLPKAQTFIQQTASNEFGAYAEIYDYLQQQDWRELEFEQIQAIIRCLKDHLKKLRLLTEPKDISQIDIKGMNTSSESKFQNKVEQAIANQSNKASIFFHDEQSEQFQYEQKWKHAKFKAVKKLLIIFDFIRKWMRVEGQSFEANQKLCEKLDLNLFMKYTKMFDLGSTFKPQKMIKSFKQNAVNQLWLDFDRFVNANLQLIGFRTATPAKEKYLRLRELLDLLSSQKIKKMLNIRNKSAVATIVEGHTGTYKQDILDYLKQKYDERRHRLEQKWKGKKLNTEPDQSRITTFEKGSYVNVSKVRSVKSLPKRAKTLEPISIHEELNLPKLRLKQSREQSIYKSLKQLDLRSQQAKVRQLVNAEQDEQYLQEYLKKEGVQKKRSKVKQAQELPRMKFT